MKSAQKLPYNGSLIQLSQACLINARQKEQYLVPIVSTIGVKRYSVDVMLSRDYPAKE